MRVAHFFEHMAEVVIENRRRNGREQSDSGSDQGIGNAGTDRAQAGAARRAEVLKCANDADNCAQQSNKRGHGRDGCKPVEILFEPRQLLVDAELQTARDGFAICDAAARLHLAADFLIAAVEDGDQRGRTILLARHHHRFQPGGFAECAQKAAIALARGSERRQFRKNDCPGVIEKQEENAQDGVGERRSLADEIPDIRLQ